MRVFFSLLFYTLFLSPILFSCKENEQNEPVDEYQFIRVGTLKLPVDSLAPNFGYHCSTFVDTGGVELLYAIHGRSLRIPIYNLSSGKLDQFIPLHKEGPDGIGQLLGAKIFTPDSILILPVNRFHFFWLNSRGKRIGVYNLLGGDAEHKRWLQASGAELPQLYKGHLYYNFIPDINTVTMKYQLDAPIFAKTMSIDSVAIVPEMKYPEFLAKIPDHETFYPEYIIVSYLIHDGKIVYTVPACANLYTFDISTKVLKAYAATSKYPVSPFTTIKVSKFDMNSIYRQKYEGTYYYRILYDKYRKFYYRINLLPSEAPKNMRAGNAFRSKPFSIQIFDLEFNCIGETLMPRNKFVSGDYFIGTKGLYISNNNPENPDYNEDSLNYSIYVPEIIK